MNPSVLHPGRGVTFTFIIRLNHQLVTQNVKFFKMLYCDIKNKIKVKLFEHVIHLSQSNSRLVSQIFEWRKMWLMVHMLWSYNELFIPAYVTENGLSNETSIFVMFAISKSS